MPAMACQKISSTVAGEGSVGAKEGGPIIAEPPMVGLGIGDEAFRGD